jgi:hypothetical protein
VSWSKTLTRPTDDSRRSICTGARRRTPFHLDSAPASRCTDSECTAAYCCRITCKLRARFSDMVWQLHCAWIPFAWSTALDAGADFTSALHRSRRSVSSKIAAPQIAGARLLALAIVFFAVRPVSRPPCERRPASCMTAGTCQNVRPIGSTHFPC